MKLQIKKRFVAIAAAVAAACTVAMHFEGLRTVAYPDMGGVYTICYGHTAGVKAGEKATDAQCLAYLQSDMAAADVAVQRVTNGKSMPVTRRAAFDDFVYNEGIGNFTKSKTLKLFMAGDDIQACDALMDYTRAGTDPHVSGLVKRREEERTLCMVGEP
jgi:lysozyme